VGRANEPGVGAKAFYAIPIADMLVFSTLIYFAFRERFNPAAHKRLILFATITLLDAEHPCQIVTARESQKDRVEN